MISKEQFCQEANNLIDDEDRKLYVKCKKRTRILLAIFLPCLIILFTLLSIFVSYIFAIIGVIITSIVAGVISSVSRFKWKDFKRKYGKPALDLLFKDYVYEYRQNCCISKSIFIASRFGGSFDSYKGEDYFSIAIKNDDGTPSTTTFAISDLYVTDTRTQVVYDRNGHAHTETYTVIIYKGAFGYIKFPFEFKCELQLNPRYKRNEKIKLEDIDFNKRFKTYTDNQMEALCILTPTMMTKLKELDKRVSNLKISIIKNNLYLGFDRDIFEPNKKITKLSGEVFSRIYDDAQSMYGIVEEIKSNNKVFKM